MTVVLVAPQEFKGTLTAAEAARAMAEGARDALPHATVVEAPMSDGGPGLFEALVAAIGGKRAVTQVRDPLMRPVTAAWAALDDGHAAIEMSAASGLTLVAPADRDPLVASTYGTGELIRAALDAGHDAIIVGVGGSATVDGGAGALQALGVGLVDASGHELPPGGGALSRLDRIDMSRLDPRIGTATLRVACDVSNKLCGPDGAAAVFGPQKGATPAAVRVLARALARFARLAERDCGIDLATVSVGGAAGGLAAGLMLAGGTIEPGFALVAAATRLDERISRADLMLTGEGRLDSQTAYGKTVAGVAAMARAHGKRVGIVAGSITGEADRSSYDAVVAATPAGVPIEDAMRRAPELVRAAAARAIQMLLTEPQR